MRPVVSEFYAVKARYLVTTPRNLYWFETKGIEHNMRTRQDKKEIAVAEEARALSRAAGRVGR